MKPYTFAELKSTAQEIFISLLEDSDEPLSISTTESGLSPAQIQAQGERIERHVNNLRAQAWGLAEAFLDYGFSRYSDEIPPQSTETTGAIPEDVAEALQDHSEHSADDSQSDEEEEKPTAKKKSTKKASTKKKASFS